MVPQTIVLPLNDSHPFIRFFEMQTHSERVFRGCPRQESNLHQGLRRPLLYPLSYEDSWNSSMRQGGCSRDRTYDRWLKRPLLYQLSYTPKEKQCTSQRIQNVSKKREIVNLQRPVVAQRACVRRYSSHCRLDQSEGFTFRISSPG